MADRELAFSTFLKLLELSTPQKATTLRGFKRGGGFNYWRPLRALAPEVLGGRLDLSDIQERVAMMAKGHQRKYNEHALTNLLKWVSRRRVTVGPNPSRLVKKFSNSGLKVRLEPEIAFTMDGRGYVMHLWATTNPTLSEESLSMGLYFLRHHFQDEVPANCQFLIFDTVKNQIFAEFSIFQNTREMLANQRKVLNDLWAEIDRDPDGSPREPRSLEIHPQPPSTP